MRRPLFRHFTRGVIGQQRSGVGLARKMNGELTRFLHFPARATLARRILRAHARPVEPFHKSVWRMRPWQGPSKLRSRNAQAKPPPMYWAPPDWGFRWSAAYPHPRCPLLISRKPTIPCPISASSLAKRKWPTSASQPSISSIRKTSASAACSSPADAAAAAAVMVAVVAVVAAAAAVVPVAEAAVVAAAADSAASGSLAASAALLVPAALAAVAAAYPGECAACAERHGLTGGFIRPVGFGQRLKSRTAPPESSSESGPA